MRITIRVHEPIQPKGSQIWSESKCDKGHCRIIKPNGGCKCQYLNDDNVEVIDFLYIKAICTKPKPIPNLANVFKTQIERSLL